MTQNNAIDGTEGPQPALGEELAYIIQDYLMAHQDKVLAVSGRIGAQPNVRFQGGRWVTATWAGAGELMFNEQDPDSVHDLIQSGPCWEIEDVEENEAWQQAIEEGYDSD